MSQLWWLCVRGHVFAAPPVPDGAEMHCPVDDGEGACGTFFIFMPYPTQADALAGHVASGPDKWAPWARSAP